MAEEGRRDLLEEEIGEVVMVDLTTIDQLQNSITTQGEGGRFSLLVSVWAHKNYSNHSLKHCLKTMWKTRHGFKLRDVGPNLYLCTFDCEDDMHSVLRGCPWLFEGQLVVMKKLSDVPSLDNPGLSSSPLWLMVTEIPGYCQKPSLIDQVAALFGGGGEVDVEEEEEEGLVKMRILMDLEKPLKRGRFIKAPGFDEFWVPFQYDKLPAFCFKCGKLGHMLNTCPTATESDKGMDESQLPYGDFLRYGNGRGFIPSRHKTASSLPPRRYVHNNNSQVVHFRSLEKPNEDDFCLEMSRLYTYDDVVKRLAKELDLDDPSKIRLTSHNCYSQQPKPRPIKFRGVEHLSDMLVHYNQTSDILYYEVLDIPLPELQGLETLKVAFLHATKDEERLKKEQEEKAGAHLYTIIKVARDDDLAEQTGKDIYFDLVDHDKVRSFRIQKQMAFNVFKEEVAKEFGVPVQFQRFWLWAKRQNHTYRPNRPLTPLEETQSVGTLREVPNKVHNAELKLFLEVELGLGLHPIAPPEKTEEDILLFFKHYDPEKEELHYVGRLFVKSTGKPIEILSKLNKMAGYAPDEEIDLYEEIKFEPLVMCDPIDKAITFLDSQLEDGDIVCFQKSLPVETTEQFRYPDVPSFLEYVRNRQKILDFGEPFSLVIHERETLAEMKAKIQKKLQVANEESDKWKFALLSLSRSG